MYKSLLVAFLFSFVHYRSHFWLFLPDHYLQKFLVLVRDRWYVDCSYGRSIRLSRCAPHLPPPFPIPTAMPPSQLKQLKSSLREHGLVGPQKSKKQKKLAAKDPSGRRERVATLDTIRNQFNPFEVKAPTRKDKFAVVGAKDKQAVRSAHGRPGVSKSLGEERRRATLLKEIHHRHRVGDFVDRRFGENDPAVTPEQRAAERFARQNERQAKKKSMFSLEDEDDYNIQLTHLGRSLTFDEAPARNAQDDFEEDGLSSLGPADVSPDFKTDQEAPSARPTKRRRLSNDKDADNDDDDAMQLPETKRSKQEVMKEVVAKAKQNKYDRQQAKEDDDDLRAELDKVLPDFLQSMRSYSKPSPAQPSEERHGDMNPDRLALLAGKDRQEADQKYNERVRQMATDKRSKPSSRTKTAEEEASDIASRLKELEQKRLRRMRGASADSDDGGDEPLPDGSVQDDAETFGLPSVADVSTGRRQLDVEDEDEFVLDDELVASDIGSEVSDEPESYSTEDLSPDDDNDIKSDSDDIGKEDQSEDQDESLAWDAEELRNSVRHPTAATDEIAEEKVASTQMPFTYPCPTSHQALLELRQGVDDHEFPTVVQRIRALHHPNLSIENREKMGLFGIALVEHIVYLADGKPPAPVRVLEILLRHLHSLAKGNPFAVARGFRNILREIAQQRPLALSPGDLILLTGVSAIFPTSDHFHSVVTPSALTIARFLGQSPIITLQDLVKGAFGCTLALQYQTLSKRYVPEVMIYIQQALASLVGTDSSGIETSITAQRANLKLQLTSSVVEPDFCLHFDDLYGRVPNVSPLDDVDAKSHSVPEHDMVEERLKATLISQFLTLLSHAAELWHGKSAFPEIFGPAIELLHSVITSQSGSSTRNLPSSSAVRSAASPPASLPPSLLSSFKSCHNKISHLSDTTISTRRPLALHSHRPLAIKSSIPKFDESFNPEQKRRSLNINTKNDPTAAQAAAESSDPQSLQRLRAQLRRERKGALRELRRDAAFVARHQLKEKREKDAAHEKKMRRLVAEIQGVEGHEGKVYEMEKERRKERRNRK